MKPIYIIVHEICTKTNCSMDPNSKAVVKEIERIKNEEEYISLDGNPKTIPPDLNFNRPIKLCGAYYSGVSEGNSNLPQCVDQQLEELLKRGYQAAVHKPGTILSSFNSKHPYYTPVPDDLLFLFEE